MKLQYQTFLFFLSWDFSGLLLKFIELHFSKCPKEIQCRSLGPRSSINVFALWTPGEFPDPVSIKNC